VPHKIGVLNILIEQAEAKGNHLDRLRQINFSMTLFIFAGLIGFGLNQQFILRLCVMVVLIGFMIILSGYDNHLHKAIHGWRKTRDELILNISELINDPYTNLNLQTYYPEGEKKARDEDCDNIQKLWLWLKTRGEKGPSRMRVVYYLLVRGAIISIIPFLVVKVTP
ncbi:hypothetical protein C5S53_02560, partial [Methanophagales archaeon]